MRFTSILTITPTLLFCANACVLSEADPGDDPVTAESVESFGPASTVTTITKVELSIPIQAAVVGEPTAEFTIDGQPLAEANVHTEATVSGPHSVSYTLSLANIAPGEHELCGSITDIAAPDGASSPTACSIIYVIDDSGPVAVCDDQLVIADDSCEVQASIDLGSYDPDGDPFDCQAYPPGPYGIGITNVTLDCRDVYGGGSACDAVVEVLDGSPVDIEAASIVLWPPDHKIHEFSLDDCIGAVSHQCGDYGGDYGDYAGFDLEIVSLTSDELENAIGDGNTCDDTLMITGATTFAIRSERQGGQDGRVYRATYRISDLAGYESYAACEVTVPTSHGKPAVDSGCALCLDAIPNDGEGCGDCPLLDEVCQ